MKRMGLAKRTIFFKYQLVWRFSFVLCGRIISILALLAGQGHYVSHSGILFLLLQYSADHAGAHGPSTLTNRKPQLLLHRNRRYQIHLQRHIVTRHHHLHTLR